MAVPGDINYVAPGTDPWDQPGGDQSQKGLASPPLGSDLKWQNSNPTSMADQYLSLDPARQQEYVKAWLGQDPQTQAQWAAAFGYGPQGSMGGSGTPTYGPIAQASAPGGYGQAPGDHGQGLAPGGGSPTGQGPNVPSMAPLGSDLNLNAGPQGMATQYQGLGKDRQQQYVNAWSGLDPATQAQWAAAFGYGPQAGGGWGPMAPSSGLEAPSAPGSLAGGPGSLSAAMASGQQAGQISKPMSVSGTNEVTSGGQGNNWVGGPGSHEDYWANPATQWRDGTIHYAPGYGRGANGETIKWEGGTPPTGGYTQAGQEQMHQPFVAGGQAFKNFNQFIKYMMTSTPGEQGIKKQLEQKDQQGGSLEPGEKSLFDLFSPYLYKGSTKPPMGATPFTDWNPVGLLDILMKSGILARG